MEVAATAPATLGLLGVAESDTESDTELDTASASASEPAATKEIVTATLTELATAKANATVVAAADAPPLRKMAHRQRGTLANENMAAAVWVYRFCPGVRLNCILDHFGLAVKTFMRYVKSSCDPRHKQYGYYYGAAGATGATRYDRALSVEQGRLKDKTNWCALHFGRDFSSSSSTSSSSTYSTSSTLSSTSSTDATTTDATTTGATNTGAASVPPLARQFLLALITQERALDPGNANDAMLISCNLADANGADNKGKEGKEGKEGKVVKGVKDVFARGNGKDARGADQADADQADADQADADQTSDASDASDVSQAFVHRELSKVTAAREDRKARIKAAVWVRIHRAAISTVHVCRQLRVDRRTLNRHVEKAMAHRAQCAQCAQVAAQLAGHACGNNTSGNDDTGGHTIANEAMPELAKMFLSKFAPPHAPESRDAPDHCVPDHCVPDHCVPDHCVPDHCVPWTGPVARAVAVRRKTKKNKKTNHDDIS